MFHTLNCKRDFEFSETIYIPVDFVCFQINAASNCVDTIFRNTNVYSSFGKVDNSKILHLGLNVKTRTDAYIIIQSKGKRKGKSQEKMGLCEVWVRSWIYRKGVFW